MLAFTDTTSTALAARLATAMRAVDALHGRPGLAAHKTTLNGVRIGLLWLAQIAQPTAAAYHDIKAIGDDLRDVWCDVRVSDAQSASALATIDQQLQGIQRLIADALKEAR